MPSLHLQLLSVLTPEERLNYQAIRAKLLSVCSHTLGQLHPPALLIDAEQSTVQAFIRFLAIEAQKIFNKETALVWNTYQAYLK